MKAVSNNRVLLGMSGGVDSTAAALLLKGKGYEVVGVTYRLIDSPSTDANIDDARRAAEKIGIKHVVADYRNVFNDIVISNFVEEYGSGRTPNPCVVCNKHIKYGEFLKTADDIGAYYIATGQYAAVVEDNGRYRIKRPKDLSKDQTYFLYTLKETILPRVMFPMWEISSKDEARRMVREAGIELYSKRDSQEICFIQGGIYSDFVKERLNIGTMPGNFVDREGRVLGRHSGIVNYTIGQRKGLGIALGKPAFVTGIDAAHNVVVLGDNEDLFTDVVRLKNVTFVNEEYNTESIGLSVKIRYAAREVPATVHIERDNAEVRLKEPVRAATAGQSAVFYDGDILAGGGIIM